MNRTEMIALVVQYFDGVDQENYEKITSTLTDDCVFSVETHGVRLTERADIFAMFAKLWASHATVLHKDFSYVVDLETGRIAAQFTVVNTELSGDITKKSNSNFFRIKNGKFSHIAVYMAGPNTLTASQ
jgi:predicted secreted hydrolase